MYLTGIDAVVFGVEDMDAARIFLTDWGLTDAGSDAAALNFTTRDGCAVTVRPIGDPSLPPAMQEGSTLRQVIWGVRDDAAMADLRDRLGDAAGAHGGMLAATDPSGLSHGFRLRQRGEVVADPQDVNGPGQHRRVDQRAQFYDRARPITVGHVVLFVDNLAASQAFFTEKLGFVVSDSYPGHAAFLRCQTPGPHHHAFVLQRPGNPGLNHVAFTVSNIHEVFGGGLAMGRAGHETELGPGRHPISSAYFWYFKSPFGGALEYYADDDWCTQAWEPREYERRPDLFAEWAIAGGIDGNTRRQARAA
ncbi:VOC family protein [Sphingomonas sp.]|uniref:VOC family protein n=1 Tax=Sphingomonas sp. TaxID=28214 RepID=UPI003BA906D8